MSMSLFSSPYVDEPHDLATPETEEDARVMCDIEYLNVNDDVHIEEHTAPKHAQVYKTKAALLIGRVLKTPIPAL